MKKILSLLLITILTVGSIPTRIYGEEDILSNYQNNMIVLDDDDILSPKNTPQPQPEEVTAVEQTTAKTTQAVLPQAVSTNTPALIVVYRVSNFCIVYDKFGQVVNSFIVSTGRKGHSSPLGTYKIYEHSTGNGYHLMVDGTYGKWCMRWKKGGYMFHSVCYAKYGDQEPIAQEVADLGTSVSRGCIRLSVKDAEWLYKATPNGCVVKVINE